jgi:hypothetical protein
MQADICRFAQGTKGKACKPPRNQMAPFWISQNATHGILGEIQRGCVTLAISGSQLTTEGHEKMAEEWPKLPSLLEGLFP